MNYRDAYARVNRFAEKVHETGGELTSKARQATSGAERLGSLGAVLGIGVSFAKTSFGGVGIAAGGTAFGLAGPLGATAAAATVGAAGFGGGYVAYKVGKRVIKSRFGDDGSKQDDRTSDPDGSPSGGGPSGPGLAGAPVGAFPRRPVGDVGAFAEARRFVREYALAVRRSGSGFPLSRE